jgi:hypothetical protein
MAGVIVNTFEIITTPQEQANERPQPDAKPAPATTLRPEDIERIVRHQRARMARVHAD